ncbi:MAG TPA: TIGR03118 family protein [Bryobacteraceae bacterium]|nr:TIGR03118 family protein [Bryobacteraceae bacterium]
MHMLTIGRYCRLPGALSLLLISFAVSSYAQSASSTQHYKQTNLVSDMSGVAGVTDPNLVNSWGLARSSGSPWWVADNGPGVSTLYSGTGAIVPLVVTIPPSDPKISPTGTPTGVVFNGGSGFEIAKGLPAAFIFVAEDGVISGWNPKVDPTHAVIKVNEKEKSVFKGATMATVNVPVLGPQSFLYVADFHKGRVQIYDSKFHHVPIPEEGFFDDDSLPPGFAPFNVQNIGGNIYVSFAQQDSDKHDEVDGAGLGYVDIFSPSGKLLRRLQHGPWFNAPWGITQASGDFGSNSHDLLIGQFGSGEILVFNPVTGQFLGRLHDASNAVITIDGLWALGFGNDAAAGPATTLFFTAGPGHEQHGLFGTITAIENAQGNGQ